MRRQSSQDQGKESRSKRGADAPGSATFVARWGDYVLNGLGLFALWMICDVIAWALRTPEHVSVWYPPAGISLAFLTYFGMRFAPVVFLVKAASLYLNWQGDVDPRSWLPGIILTTLLSMAEALALRALIAHAERWKAFRFTFAFLLLAGIFPLLKGTVFASAMRALGPIPAGRVGHAIAAFWSGDAIGNICFTLLFLLVVFPLQDEARARLTGRPRRPSLLPIAWSRPDGPWSRLLGEALLLFALLFCVKAQAADEQYRFWYLMIYPLLAITLRHGLGGASLAVPMVSFGLAWLELDAPVGIDPTYLPFFFATVGAAGLLTGALVTEQKESAQRYADLKKSLEAANAVKSRFLTSVAEEIRAPLLRIVGDRPAVAGASLASLGAPRDPGPAGAAEGGSAPVDWEKEGHELLTKLHELLDGLKRTGAVAGSTTNVDVPDTVGHILGQLRAFADACGVRVRPVRCSGKRAVRIDSHRFAQGMNYILQAAIRLAQGSSVAVSCEGEEGSDARVRIVIAIARLADDVPLGWLRQLFERDEPVPIDYVPTGSPLGLALGKYVLEGLDVDVAVKVNYFGHGLALHLRLPPASAREAV